jgi:hypothetical protein
MTRARFQRRTACLALALALALGPASADARDPKQSPKVEGEEESGNQWSGFYWSGSSRRGYLGVQLLRLNDELRGHFGAPPGVGVLVSKVEPGSPAAKAGVRVGDVLTAVDGQRADAWWSVAQLIRDKREGEKVKLKVVRKGKTLKLTAAIQARKRPQVEVGRFFRFGPVGPRPGLKFHWDSRSFHDAMKDFERRMKEQGHKGYFKYLKREKDLEKRLREMEKKLRKLERRLKTSSGRSRAPKVAG